jgi:hypothetical protein
MPNISERYEIKIANEHIPRNRFESIGKLVYDILNIIKALVTIRMAKIIIKETIVVVLNPTQNFLKKLFT